MKILITGSEGLIGSALCFLLQQQGHQVKHFDISFPKDHQDYGDILDIDTLRGAAKECDGIVHYAAVSRVIWGKKNPELCRKTNIIGTQNVISVAEDSLCCKWLLFSSSREIYGQKAKLPVKIDASYAPMNVYAESKVAGEKIVLNSRCSKLNSAIVRYSNVYGSIDDHLDRVMPAFCRAAAIGGDLRIEGGENRFDFTHLDDTVAGTLLIVNKLIGGEILPPLHLTTGVSTSLNELADLVCSVNNNGSNRIEAPPRNFDVATFAGDIETPKRIIGYRPKVALKNGVERLTKAFMRQEKLLS